MVSWFRTLRTVREEPKFSEQVSQLGISHLRIDAALFGLKFALARIPEEFETIPGTSLSIAKTVVYPNAPALRIYFTYNEDEVHLMGIEFAEDDCAPF